MTGIYVGAIISISILTIRPTWQYFVSELLAAPRMVIKSSGLVSHFSLNPILTLWLNLSLRHSVFSKLQSGLSGLWKAEYQKSCTSLWSMGAFWWRRLGLIFQNMRRILAPAPLRFISINVIVFVFLITQTTTVGGYDCGSIRMTNRVKHYIASPRRRR